MTNLVILTYKVGPKDTEMNSSNKNPCSYAVHVGNMGERHVSNSGSHDKIKGVIVLYTRNNLLFTNDTPCQVHTFDLEGTRF